MNVEHVFIIAVIHCTMVANVVESVPVQGMSHANHFFHQSAPLRWNAEL